MEELNLLTHAISSIFQCKIIEANTIDNTIKRVEGRECHKDESPIYFAVTQYDPVKITSLLFTNENYEKFEMIKNLPQSEFLKHDGLGRLHLNTPHSGPLFVKIRAQKFHSTNIVTHITDIYNILQADPQKYNKPVLMLMSDGGPDFNPLSLLNELYLYRLFKKIDADILSVFTYAARYSAFNCIEHAWSPLSNHLTGVVFSPTIEGESIAPALASTTIQ